MKLKTRLRAALAAFCGQQIPADTLAEFRLAFWDLKADIEALKIAAQHTLVIACMELEHGDAKLRDLMYEEVRREVFTRIESADLSFEDSPERDRVEIEEGFRARIRVSANKFLARAT